MNKVELSSAVAEKIGTDRKTAEKAVDAVFDIITETVAKGEKVRIVGFGSYDSKVRKGFQGHKPNTTEVCEIKSRRVPVFKSGKDLKEAVAK